MVWFEPTERRRKCDCCAVELETLDDSERFTIKWSTDIGQDEGEYHYCDKCWRNRLMGNDRR